ncbi:MAG: NYN domain-containing protein [Leptospirales bacterium]|nr:NYN domain-containing protein [Leptospirales bacterium]
MNPLRTFVYVDGFNLYYGQLRHSKHKWLDLVALCRKYLDPARNAIERIKYFTARVVPRPQDPDQNIRQQAYLRALATFPEIEIIYGNFLSHKVKMPRADGSGLVEVIKTEEKKSDVNMAVHMLNDAFKNRYDLCVLISNDSDLSEPLRIVKEELVKKIAILNPHQKTSRDLKQYATFYKQIRASAIAACQLPAQLKDKHGLIHKPKSW